MEKKSVLKEAKESLAYEIILEHGSPEDLREVDNIIASWQKVLDDLNKALEHQRQQDTKDV